MTRQHYIDQIPDCLAGNLDTAARRAFEKALLERADLKEAMAIWQELDEVLAPAPEDQMLANMTRLRKEATPKRRTAPWPWKLGIPLFLLIGGLSWYFGPGTPAGSSPAEPPAALASDSLEIPVDTLAINPEDSLPAIPVNPPPVPAPPIRNPPHANPEPEEEPPPVIAANYDPNPRIEAEMTEQFRGGDVELEVTDPAPGTTIKSVKGMLDIALTGTISTNLSQDALTLRLLLLSNSVEDYE